MRSDGPRGRTPGSACGRSEVGSRVEERPCAACLLSGPASPPAAHRGAGPRPQVDLALCKQRSEALPARPLGAFAPRRLRLPGVEGRLGGCSCEGAPASGPCPGPQASGPRPRSQFEECPVPAAPGPCPGLWARAVGGAWGFCRGSGRVCVLPRLRAGGFPVRRGGALRSNEEMVFSA